MFGQQARSIEKVVAGCKEAVYQRGGVMPKTIIAITP